MVISRNDYVDSFRKIVVLYGNASPWMDEDGVMYMGIIPFLLGK